MIIFQAPAPQTFLEQLEGFLILFLSAVVPALATYVVYKLNAMHAAQAAHNSQSSAKLNAIVSATPGAEAHLAANPPIAPQA
jgi:hypothetical protein